MEPNTEKLLRELAGKLGTTTEHLYGVLVKQSRVYYIQAIVNIISAIVGGILLAIPLFFVHWETPKAIKLEFEIDYSWTTMSVIYVISLGVNIIYWIVGLCYVFGCINELIGYKLNPEYQAVKDIINTIKD